MLDSTLSANVIEAIIKVLNGINRPIGADEISFRTRASQSLVSKSLKQLKEANVVLEMNQAYQLNREEKEYRLKSLLQ